MIYSSYNLITKFYDFNLITIKKIKYLSRYKKFNKISFFNKYIY